MYCRFVNCARAEGEQNLIAFQYKQKIYYKAYKDIARATELLTYYGDDVSDNFLSLKEKS